MKKEDIRNKIQESSEQLEEQGRAVMERTKNAVAVIEDYVHEKPWLPIGVVAAVALLVGILIGHRQR